jgi:hypothetical protein
LTQASADRQQMLLFPGNQVDADPARSHL